MMTGFLKAIILQRNKTQTKMWKVFKSQEKRETPTSSAKKENMEENNLQITQDAVEPAENEPAAELETPALEAATSSPELENDSENPNQEPTETGLQSKISPDSSDKTDKNTTEEDTEEVEKRVKEERENDNEKETVNDKENEKEEKPVIRSQTHSSDIETSFDAAAIKEMMEEMNRLKEELASLHERYSMEITAAKREGIAEGRNQKIETQMLDENNLNHLFPEVPDRRVNGVFRKSSIFDLANDAR